MQVSPYPDKQFLFVSCSSLQLAPMLELKELLAANDILVLGSQELYLCGDRGAWQDAAIQNSVGMLVCVSDKYMESQWCRQELGFARDVHNKPIYPVSLREADLKDVEEAKRMLEARAWANISESCRDDPMGGTAKLVMSLKVKMLNQSPYPEKPFVFMSVHDQRSSAMTLSSALEKRGVKVLGQKELHLVGDQGYWQDEPISKSAALICCLSTEYLNSASSRKELQYALTYEKPIVPVVIDTDAMMDSINLSQLLRHHEYSKITTFPKGTGLDHDQTLDAIAEKSAEYCRILAEGEN